MIGPHEGKELELMLAGMKKLAMFHDVVPPSGQIAEEIIPENAFASYVQQGQFKRFSSDIKNLKNEDIIRYVCFTLPGEEWRAAFLLWLKEQFYSGYMEHSSSHDEIIGKLLSYTDDDIHEFLNQ